MIERLRPHAVAAPPRAALFDFDGTLSPIRSGWMDVMIPMMTGILRQCGTGDSDLELTHTVRDFVFRLTGKQTIYQMIELAEQVRLRGGQPEDPLAYKRLYLQLLNARIADRLAALRGEAVDPDRYTVSGSRALLQALRLRGLTLYRASGTDELFVKEEAALLGLATFFDGGIYGAQDDYLSFSKRILIQNLIAQSRFSGPELLGFGDGYVEIENVKEAGGTAVGVASDEPDCRGVDAWKRDRLIRSGADYIIPHFLELHSLLAELFPPS